MCWYKSWSWKAYAAKSQENKRFGRSRDVGGLAVVEDDDGIEYAVENEQNGNGLEMGKERWLDSQKPGADEGNERKSLLESWYTWDEDFFHLSGSLLLL